VINFVLIKHILFFLYKLNKEEQTILHEIANKCIYNDEPFVYDPSSKLNNLYNSLIVKIVILEHSVKKYMKII
jgi:hypothetical protein